MLGLYRAPGSPNFDSREKNLLRTIAPRLAEAASRALLLGEAADPESSDAPGVLIIDNEWVLVSATSNAGHWLEELPDGDTAAGRLPSAVQSVVLLVEVAHRREGSTNPQARAQPNAPSASLMRIMNDRVPLSVPLPAGAAVQPISRSAFS
jgi:hypothetical protein